MIRRKETKIIDNIKRFIDGDYDYIKENLSDLLGDYQKQSKRLDTIIKQSDKQQFRLLELNEELDLYKNKLEEKELKFKKK